MGKKGKRSAKAGGKAAKQGPGKARRERSAALREIEARIEALIEKLEDELKDVELFGPLVPREECPICFVPMPRTENANIYMNCCGKYTCIGCARTSIELAMKKRSDVATMMKCAFCRSDMRGGEKKQIEMTMKRADSNDQEAMLQLANHLNAGSCELEVDDIASIRLVLQAAEGGHHLAIARLANFFFQGGSPLPKNIERAIALAFAAAKLGYITAYTLLWLVFADKIDAESSAMYIAFAAINGCSDSMEILNDLIEEGKVKQVDIDAVRREYEEALKVEWTEEREKAKKLKALMRL